MTKGKNSRNDSNKGSNSAKNGKGKGNHESEEYLSTSEGEEKQVSHNSKEKVVEQKKKKTKPDKKGKVLEDEGFEEVRTESPSKSSPQQSALGTITFPSFHELHENRSGTDESSDSEESDKESEDYLGEIDKTKSSAKTLEGEERQIDEENEAERKRKLDVLYDVLNEQPHLLSSELKEALSAKLKTTGNSSSVVDSEKTVEGEVDVNKQQSFNSSSSSSTTEQQATTSNESYLSNSQLLNEALLEALSSIKALHSKTATNTVVMTEDNLPNKFLTIPLSISKVEKYVDAVKRLLNSNTSYTENRNAFDAVLEKALDFNWKFYPDKVDPDDHWKTIDLNQFKRFLNRVVSTEPASFINESIGLQCKTMIQKGVVLSANNVQLFINKIAELQATWDLIPADKQSSDSRKAAQRDLSDQLKKNLPVIVEGEPSTPAYNQY